MSTEATAGTPPSVSSASAGIIVEGILITEDYVFGYGRDLTPRERRMALKYLMQRDGLKCSLGDDMLQLDQDGFPIADIHHRDGARNHKASLLSLACHRHNAQHGHPPVAWSTTAEKEREKSGRALIDVDLTEASAEVRISGPLYEWYQLWLEQAFKGTDRVSLRDAIYEAARKAREMTGHGSPQTFREYLKMLTASGGLYAVDRTAKVVVKVEKEG